MSVYLPKSFYILPALLIDEHFFLGAGSYILLFIYPYCDIKSVEILKKVQGILIFFELLHPCRPL